MKYIKIFSVITLLFNIPLRAQDFYASGGMGLNYITMEKLNYYLHYNWNFDNRKDDYHSAIEFYALAGSNLSPNFSIETSFGISLNSFSNSYELGIYQLEYTFYYPELNFLYDVNFPNSGLQFGAGIGYVLGRVDEIQPFTIQKITDETKGFSFQIKSVMYASLGSNLSAEITLNYRFALLNDLFYDNFFINHTPYEKLNLSFTSIGIKLGVRYKL